MSTEIFTLLIAGIFIIAVLYSTVGHAGASGYIAVMALLGLAPATIKPTALALNILVACIATWQFTKAGHFSMRLFWPFAVLAVPFSFLGGAIALPAAGFKILMGIVLLYSAARLLVKAKTKAIATPPPLPMAMACGAIMGLLAGLTGTGGGIFLTPLLLLNSWATPKTAAAVSAFFILLNSIAGLLGNLSSAQTLPPFILPLLAAAGLGGALGSRIGSQQLNPAGIRKFLAIVLVIAGLKLVLT